ncbi:hypothetical protein ES708_00312 [subsurface metagenome]
MLAPGVSPERRRTMPGFDATGPRGRGPMTGGGRGFCAVPLSAPQQELDFLKNQSQALREQLEQIETRIRDMEITRAKSALRSK